jgi:hypothetical protein
MSSIQYWHHEDDAALDFFASAFATKNLVPIIGSGFTRGCLTTKGKVPSGEDYKNEMLAEIAKHRQLSDLQKEKLAKKSFSEIADYYFDEKWVPKDVVAVHLENCFKGVILPAEKVAFINEIDWPYIYTLNVDDAIEKISSYEKVLPYNEKLSARAKEQKTLFKLHGDIDYELRHDDSRLIFKKADYLQALTTNRQMLDLLKLDIVNKNVVYIGCSLSDELDISFIVAQQNKDRRLQTKNVIFLSEKLDELDEQEYINVGVNCVILIDRGSYDQMYNLIIKAFQHSATINQSLSAFSGEITRLTKDPEKNLDFFVKGVVELNSEDRKYRRVLPYYYSPRAKEIQIFESLLKNEVTIISGNRVSGRTLTAYNILNKIKDKTVFVVESNMRVDNRAIVQLLGQKNAMIFFDSLSLSRDELYTISRHRKHLRDNGSRVMICSEAYSRDIEQILEGPGVRTGVINLSETLTKGELSFLNKKAIDCRLPTFTTGKSLLDKVFSVFTIIGERNFITKVPQTKDLFKLLYVLAVRNQFTGQEIHFSGLDFSSVQQLVAANDPYIEFEKISAGEQIDHTSYKVTTRASSWVVSVLREVFRVKGVAWCVETLMELFASSYDSNKLLVIELRKFDSINFVFGEGEKGAAALIISVYDKLESIEGAEAEFYVQKAKAYYNMYVGDDLRQILTMRVRELDRAMTWAKTDHLHSTERNIIHAKALICLRRVAGVLNPTNDDIIEALDALLSTISAEGNSVYLRNFLEGKTTGSNYLQLFLKLLRRDAVRFPILLTLRGQIEELESKIVMALESVLVGGKAKKY